MIIKAFFIALVANCYMQTSNAADIGYGQVCADGDVCTDAGTACLLDGGSKKCVCDATKHWIANQGNTACVCDAAKFWQLDSGSSSCKCAPTYVLDVSTCRGTIDSTVCKAPGSECSTVTDSYCDATALKCKCPAITTAATNICTYKACTSADTCTALDKNTECSGNTVNDKCRCLTTHAMGNEGKCALKCTADTICTAADTNSECSGTTALDKCRCKTGYRLGSDGMCAGGGGGGGAAGLLVSVSILLACLLATLF